MQYRVIVVRPFAFSINRALERLTKQVSEAIALGWEPTGGPVVLGTAVLQAMVKRR